jgi:membrane-bound lytic murein transglycosylase B
MSPRTRAALAVAVLLAWGPGAAMSSGLRADHAAFIEDMVARHAFDRAELTALFRSVERRQDVIDAIMRPAEGLPWHRYRTIFVTGERIGDGVRFWDEHGATLARAAHDYGVAPAIIVAIVGVESKYGRAQGRYRVVDALVTLGFDYPPRAAFFRSELEHFLLLVRENGIDPHRVTGSYAGAMGSPQFISSSYRAYAIDYDGSGTRDLWNSWPDVIGSVANYLHRHGWQRDGPVAVRAALGDPAALALATRRLDLQTTVGALRAAGVRPAVPLDDGLPANLLMLETSDRGDREHWIALPNFAAITRYNRSPLYAMAVHQLAEQIAQRRAGR